MLPGSMAPEPSARQPIPFGRFKLIRRIGAGGMGEVFLARDEAGVQPRACVVKKVLPELAQNPAFVGRFLDESKVVLRLRHPNVARVFAMGEVKGECFLAMEYIQGKTVSRFARRLRQRQQVLPVGLVLQIGERLCRGLAYAHDATDEKQQPLHLVHRDLSPANVCVSYRGEVKIIDFGAAQSTLKLQHTAPRVVIGNLSYMAPEQARKQIVDRRADVYSAAVLLWELLSWQQLPQKGDPVERWRKAANPAWEPPSRHRQGVPPEVDQAILKGLCKNREERYPDAAAFGAELARLRQKHTPDATERDLGAMLSLLFQEEKAAEDAMLEEALGGAPLGEQHATTVLVIPPTALAFEHRALEAPADFVPEDNPAGSSSQGGLTPSLASRKAPRGRVSHTRVAFALPFAALSGPRLEQSLVHEIEGLGTQEDFHTTPYATPGRRRWLLLGAAVFLAASGLGFGAIFLGERLGFFP